MVPPVKLPSPIPSGWIRLHCWNSAGARFITIPRTQAADTRRHLIAEGNVVWESKPLQQHMQRHTI